MTGPILRRASARYLTRHPWQFGLSVLGIALGVAVVVSVDLSNAAATRSFQIATEAVTGDTTHQIIAGSRGVDEALYRRLRVEHGIRSMAPVVEGWVSLSSEPARRLRVLGVDPFAERAIRSVLGRDSGQTAPNEVAQTLLVRADVVAITATTAAELGVVRGDWLDVEYGGSDRRLQVGLILAPDTALQRAGLRDVLLMDIAAAQELLGREGRLDRIDLVLEAEGAEALGALLPPNVTLQDAAARSDTTLQMTRAFRLNLTGMSLLALVCGTFLIYNTMTFSVVQRRSLIGSLRVLGVTRREVFSLILAEALLVGVAGTGLGLVGGVMLARVLVQLVTRTINDLYFVVSVQGVGISPASIGVGVLLGVGATLLAALPPAFEATRSVPRAALMRSAIEDRTRVLLPRLALGGVVLFLVGFAVIVVPGGGLGAAFAGLFVTLIGAALTVPLATLLFTRVLGPPARAGLGGIGALAVRGIASNLSRTAVAVAALMIAVSVIIGVGVMVASFRSTLVDWLEHTLEADLYVSAASRGPADLHLDAAGFEAISALPLVERVRTIRTVQLDSMNGPTTLLVLGGDLADASAYRLRDGNPERAWAQLLEGAIWVSEPYAERFGITVGDRLTLPADRGLREFEVAAVYYSYASDRGAVTMPRSTYETFWDDPAISGLALHATSGADLTALADQVRALWPARQQITIVSNRELREQSLVVFDRTFLITNVLRVLVTLVAFVGVMSSLMAQQFERARELAMLRATGMTPRQLWALVTAQSGLLGMIAGLLAMPLGLFLAWVMIDVINKRSFGWTLQMVVAPGTLLQALAVAVVAALLAGVIPSRTMASIPPARALREE